MSTIKFQLQSSDGVSFQVDVEVFAKCSKTLRVIIDDLGMEDVVDEVIPLPNVNSAALERVIRWANHHKDDPPPPEDDAEIDDDISEWDQQFMKDLSDAAFYELASAAEYLDIKGLKDLCQKY